MFAEFSTLQSYLDQQVKVVTAIKTEQDRNRNDIMEEVITIIVDAVNLDYSFLLMKGEQAFMNFITFMDNLFANSFSYKLKLSVLTLLVTLLF